MPEGHTLHRLADELRRAFAGDVVGATSPQGRFHDGAALLDRSRVEAVEAWGKHLFCFFEAERILHVHLGLYGTFVTTPAPGVPPRGAVRLRLSSHRAVADLRGPTACAVLTRGQRDLLIARLGPDPLRDDAEPARGWVAVRGSRRSMASLLMDQSVISGIGNVYRAEILFRHRLAPSATGHLLVRGVWDDLWDDLVVLMHRGVETGRIDTVLPQHEPDAMGGPPRNGGRGGEVYVYRRTGQPCLICGSRIRTRVVEGRNLYWCPGCQRRHGHDDWAPAQVLRLPSGSGSRQRRRAAQVMVGIVAESVTHETSPRARAAAAQARRAFDTALGSHTGDSRTLVAMALFAALCLVAALADYGWFPLSAFALPLVLGSLLLERLHFAALCSLIAGCVVTTVVVTEATTARLAWAGVMTLLGAMLLLGSYRSQLGAHGRVSESMLIDLRDRLQTQSELPPLPEQWYAQAMMRSADEAQFAGDFIVATKTKSSTLEVVVVDVSGKGLAAGTRALQLSGAFGGLLGALPPEEFLPAANQYLLRQDWSEGFATAAHLTVSLQTGTFELRTAGHPPGVQWRAGSGRWQVHESHGPALGLIDAAEFLPVEGRLESGDALMLYTDGLVETPERDYTLGIDKLLGESERMLAGGWENSAGRLLERLDSAGDDRAILFLHRR